LGLCEVSRRRIYA